MMASQDILDQELPIPKTFTLQAKSTFVRKTLSPMVRELEEPDSTKKAHLDSMVREWRESAVRAVGSIGSTGQPSLNPANMPTGADVELALDMDDFAWSISSAGPPLESPASPNWPEPLPSVHILDRMQGSVCNTPTTCTSWGPPSDVDELTESITFRLPSPDIGQRVVDFVPLTPSTATSWGPVDLPSPGFSPYSYSRRAPSIDLGLRNRGSVPVTPSTATTWGPADTPLLSPCSPAHLPSPDIGDRLFLELEEVVSVSEVWRLVWPYRSYSDVTKATPSSMTIPKKRYLLPQYPDFTALYPSECGVERAGANKIQPVLTTDYAYPFLNIYNQVYPHNLVNLYPPFPQACRVDNDDKQDVELGSSLSQYPDFATLCSLDSSVELMDDNKPQAILATDNTYPSLRVYNLVYPHNVAEIYSPWPQDLWKNGIEREAVIAVSHTIPSAMNAQASYSSDTILATDCAYPSLRIYNWVYPYNVTEIYSPLPKDLWKDGFEREAIIPPAMNAQTSYSSDIILATDYTYPSLRIYNWVYPHNVTEIYSPWPKDLWKDGIEREAVIPPAMTAQTSYSSDIILATDYTYPSLRIYNLVYPHNVTEIYSPWPKDLWKDGIEREAVIAVPHTVPPAMNSQTNYSSDIILATDYSYPSLRIYNLVYPHNVTEIYSPWPQDLWKDGIEREAVIPPAMNAQTSYSSDIILATDYTYPSLRIYNRVYPHNVTEIYSPWPQDLWKDGIEKEAIIPPAMNAQTSYSSDIILATDCTYPSLRIYNRVYPHNVTEIYSPLPQDLRKNGIEREAVIAVSHTVPPAMNAETSYSSDIILATDYTYPSLRIYNWVYPHNVTEIYSPWPQDLRKDGIKREAVIEVSHTVLPAMNTQTGHSSCDINLALYPYNLDYIYPVEHTSAIDQSPSSRVGWNAYEYKRLQYPYLDIYPAIYPYNLMAIYPNVVYSSVEVLDIAELHSAAASTYPMLDIYPSVANDPLCDMVDYIATETKGTTLSVGYPYFDIYPRVYPYSLECIYPLAGSSPVWTYADGVIPSQFVEYPFFQLFSAVYPFSLEKIYPDVLVKEHTMSDAASALLNSGSSSERTEAEATLFNGMYPSLNIYPAVYPWNLEEIYPNFTEHSLEVPAVIPNFYDTGAEEWKQVHSPSIKMSQSWGYPTFSLYPAPQGYPTFDIYPPVWDIQFPKDLPVRQAVYPKIEIYPPVYSDISIHDFDFNSTFSRSLILSSHKEQPVKLGTAYPFIDIYHPVYPHLVIYPRVQLDDVTLYWSAPIPGVGSSPTGLLDEGSLEKNGNRTSSSLKTRTVSPPLAASDSMLNASSFPRCKSGHIQSDSQSATSALETISQPHSYQSPPRRHRRTHYELYMMIFDQIQEVLKHTERLESELCHLSTSSPPSLTHQPVLEATKLVPELNPSTLITSNEETATSIIRSMKHLSSASIVDADSGTPLDRKTLAVLPLSLLRKVDNDLSPPAVGQSVLARVRSMNLQTRSPLRPPEDRARSLDRSKSMSETNKVGRSIVLERAKMFSAPEERSRPVVSRSLLSKPLS